MLVIVDVTVGAVETVVNAVDVDGLMKKRSAGKISPNRLAD